MYTIRPCCWGLLLALCFVFAGAAASQDLRCSQIHSAADMARARSTAALSDEKKRAGAGYLVEIVAASRAFELHSTDKALASALLNLIPQSDSQQTIVMTLGDSLCDPEDVFDMEALARVRDALPRNLSVAVALVPRSMPAYVSYSLVATLDPHSDYAIQMERVCRGLRQEFTRAVHAMPPGKRKWFAEHVFDPQACRALALPESK